MKKIFKYALLAILSLIFIIAFFKLLEFQKIKGWNKFDNYGLKFSYPKDWKLEPMDFEKITENQVRFVLYTVAGNLWEGDRLVITIIKDYIPIVGVEDKLLSYATEYGSYAKFDKSVLKEKKISGRRVLEYKTDIDDNYQNTLKWYIDLPEQNGLVYLYFPDEEPKKTLDEQTQKIFLPLISSLKIGDYDWKQEMPLLFSSIKNQVNSNWILYQGKDFSLKYPTTWKVSETKDPDYLDLININLEPVITSKIDDLYRTKIIIGTSSIFSTSGALCANHNIRQCQIIGSAKVQIKEKFYYGDIIDKNTRVDGNKEFYDSFYVLRINPNRIPAEPSVITAIFKNKRQGQEIVDILSTISY